MGKTTLLLQVDSTSSLPVCSMTNDKHLSMSTYSLISIVSWEEAVSNTEISVGLLEAIYTHLWGRSTGGTSEVCGGDEGEHTLSIMNSYTHPHLLL